MKALVKSRPEPGLWMQDVPMPRPGPIGLMCAAVCRFLGARRVVVSDVNDDRLALAERLGASRAVNPRRESPCCRASRWASRS